jgi:heat shock protein HslJ
MLIFFAIITFIVSSINCNDSKKTATDRLKSNQPQVSLQETYWKLYSLMGKTVPHADTSLKREANITFSKDGRATGNGGCNSFSGNYELNGSSQILFGPIMSTKMYCNDANYENLFFDILSKSDNYFIKKDTLYLRNKQMDSTASFVAKNKLKGVN